MDLNITRRDNVVILQASGRLDSNSAPSFEEGLIKVVDGEPAIVLDMAGFSYISSAGLRVLLVAAKKCKTARRKLALCCLTPEVRLVFEISGFLALFSIFSDISEAVASVQ